ncbi:PqqD family protein [Pseudarthrobacter sp. TAF60_1]|uniref:PqqD family protein n=1 Tax=Pseudarthrobacter sp. TAF60_1 TaxID=3233071 RepID=UPI003F9DE0CF
MIWRHSNCVAKVRTESANRLAVLHLDANQPVVLEGTAVTIWDLIDGERTEQALLAELECCFEDQTAQMQSQIEAFLANLAAQHLIEPAHATNQ